MYAQTLTILTDICISGLLIYSSHLTISVIIYDFCVEDFEQVLLKKIFEYIQNMNCECSVYTIVNSCAAASLGLACKPPSQSTHPLEVW